MQKVKDIIEKLKDRFDDDLEVLEFEIKVQNGVYVDTLRSIPKDKQ